MVISSLHQHAAVAHQSFGCRDRRFRLVNNVLWHYVILLCNFFLSLLTSVFKQDKTDSGNRRRYEMVVVWGILQSCWKLLVARNASQLRQLSQSLPHKLHCICYNFYGVLFFLHWFCCFLCCVYLLKI